MSATSTSPLQAVCAFLSYLFEEVDRSEVAISKLAEQQPTWSDHRIETSQHLHRQQRRLRLCAECDRQWPRLHHDARAFAAAGGIDSRVLDELFRSLDKTIKDLVNWNVGVGDPWPPCRAFLIDPPNRYLAALQAEIDGRTSGQHTQQPNGDDLAGKEDMALALFFKHPTWTLKEIASEMGVSRASLYKMPTFRKAAIMDGRIKPRRGARKASALPKGFKTRAGHVEAEDNRESRADAE